MFKKVDISSIGIMVKDMENVEDMNNGNMWCFGIILKSQLKFMTDIKCVFMDLTDKLNYSENEYEIFTYKIVIKNALMGEGSPIGFMICIPENQEVLGAYLRHYVTHQIIISRIVINSGHPKQKLSNLGITSGRYHSRMGTIVSQMIITHKYLIAHGILSKHAIVLLKRRFKLEVTKFLLAIMTANNRMKKKM